jgi:hypothetical protein
MAVVNTKSAAITNADASPPVSNNRATDGGFQQVKVGSVAIAAADDDTSVYRMVRLPSNAIITSLVRYNDAITGGTSYGLGVYQTAENGGAVVSATTFAATVDISAGTVSGVNQRFTTALSTTIGQRLWEILALASDPNRDYDICWTSVTNGSGAGQLNLVCHYST